MKSRLDNNGIEIYSTHNDEKPVASERSIRTLENKIYKHMAAVTTKMYMDKLDGIVEKCNNI